MNQSKLLTVIQSPLQSEKAYRIADQSNQVAFRVSVGATKREIKQAVEQIFEVKVDEVRTLNMKGKQRRFGRIQGRTKAWKKAYVALKPGYDIDFGGVE